MCLNRNVQLAFLASLFFVFGCGNKKEGPKGIVLEVPVINVLTQDVPVMSEFTGQTLGEEDIQIAPRVKGLIEKIHFKEGSFVKKGQLLYEIESLTYQNNVSVADAKLAEAKTNLAAAKSDFERMDALVKMKAVSQREFEAAKAKYDAGNGQLSSAEAQLRNAKIDLGYCFIKAPIAGIIGISKFQIGSYVSPGPQSILTTISSTSSIRVRFTIAEQEYLRLYKEKQKADNNLNTGSGIHLKLSDGSDYGIVGSYSFANREVDPTTGAIILEAKFSNPDQLLRPGQYVKVLVSPEIRKNALVIPQRAVIEMQGIYQVYVLGDSNKVNLTIIQPGPSFKDAYVVESGIKSTDKIAIGGTMLLKNGSTIIPKPTEWNPGLNAEKPSNTK
jgi:membrane fusion protein (multidrug efflux system)